MKTNPRLPVALIAIGSVLMIIGSVVGLVSGSKLFFVGLTGAVGAMCLAIAIGLYRQSGRRPEDDD